MQRLSICLAGDSEDRKVDPPGGMLLHGIMSSIAEFYSRNLANEVMKGMGEKARNGGTLGKAPLGYVNVRGRDERGREVRTVELDQQRAPLLRLAFSEYATGNWTVRQLADHLNTLGLSIPPTPRRPAKPITATRLHEILRHPYYKGIVTFQGVEYPGKHEPLVDEETWQAVQAVLGSHRSGERERMHNHFLKSTVVCGQCGSRLLVQNTKNGKGVLYPYFICARRQRLHDCSFKAVLIEVVEAQMQEVYRRLYVSEADRQEIERYLLAELARIEGEKDRNVRSLTARRTNLEDERRRLLQAHYAGAVPLELLKEEQDRLGRELAGIQRQLDAYQADAKLVRAHVEQALDLLEDCYRLYMAAPDHLRKQLNQVFFERVLVNPAVDEEGRVVLPGDGGDDGAGGEVQDADDGVRDAGDEPDGQRGRDEQEPGVRAVDDAGDEPTRRADEAPCSVRVTDTGSDVCLEARLNRPFDQLASARLRAVARIAALRKTPTSTGGGRRSSAETAAGAVSQGEGLYSDAVVRFSKLDTNNWKPLLAFRKRLIAGEVAPEPSTSSVAPTGQESETTTARGILNMACRPISAAKKQQILSLERTGMSAREIAVEVGVTESTVRATCRQAMQPPRHRRRFTSDDLQRAQQLHAQGRTYIEIGLELGFGRDTVSKHLAVTAKSTSYETKERPRH